MIMNEIFQYILYSYHTELRALARFYVMMDKPYCRFGKSTQLAENLF